MRSFLVATTFAGLGTLAACSSSSSTGSMSPGMSADAVTFHRDVEPILQKHCQGCHVSGGIAPMPLITYADAKPYAQMMVNRTQDGSMPPWGAQNTSECTPPLPWKDDLRLSAAEKATVQSWQAAGHLEGDIKDAPPALAPAAPGLPGGSSLQTPSFALGDAAADDFRCFVLDPKLTSAKNLDGTFFIPGNKTVVHHALAFAIPASATTPGDQYECPGGPNVDSASLVAAWAPGGVPAIYPDGVALPLEAGTRFVIQIHYHPHENATKDPDSTAFQFRFTDVVPTYLVYPRLIGNFKSAPVAGIGLLSGPDDPDRSTPVFDIPANVKGHTETMQFTMPAKVNGLAITQLSILGVGTHMHLVGVDEKITLSHAVPAPGAPADQCLMQEPHWNFNWQRGYQYDAPLDQLPLIKPGDVLTMRCTYDNTTDNALLMTALGEQHITTPGDVKLGETTLDEMCLGAFSLLYKVK